jgi:hypothetical protein
MKPNSGQKLRSRIIKVLLSCEKPLTLADIELGLQNDATFASYPLSDSGKLISAMRRLKQSGKIEIVEPLFPDGLQVLGNRELTAVEWRYIRCQIPTLQRLAMIVDDV